MLIDNMNILNYDPVLWKIMRKELERQEKHINLIASENYASFRVMQIQGSQLTNKYAEGYPGKRYYEGCEYVDLIEKLAIKRAKDLFGADYVNVQPHSGSQANFAVYSAFLNPGDTVLSMDLSHGGHLTHGSSVNFSGKLYNFLHYGTDKNGFVNYNQIIKLSKIYNPKMIVSGFSSYSGLIDWKKMREIADDVGAYLFVDMAHIAGLVVAGFYPNPLPYAHIVTTTTHKTLAGPRGGLILSKWGNNKFYKKLDSAVFPGTQGGPLMHVIAAKAIALKEAMEPEFKVYQYKVINNAKSMVKIFLSRNFKIVFSSTENHLFLLNLTDKNINGKEASEILSRVNIIVNKNNIPNDLKSPFITSGIRIGTPAVTRRGFIENDVCELANWICDVIENKNDNMLISNIKNKVLDICNSHPVYNNI